LIRKKGGKFGVSRLNDSFVSLILFQRYYLALFIEGSLEKDEPGLPLCISSSSPNPALTQSLTLQLFIGEREREEVIKVKKGG
jgi:hypothetical protein